MKLFPSYWYFYYQVRMKKTINTAIPMIQEMLNEILVK